jgi:hypothetical protein
MEGKEGKPYRPEDVLVQEGPNKGNITDKFEEATVVEVAEGSTREIGQKVLRVGELPVIAAEEEDDTRYGVEDDEFPSIFDPVQPDRDGLRAAANEVGRRARAEVSSVEPGVGHNLTTEEISLINSRRKAPVSKEAHAAFIEEQRRLSQERKEELKSDNVNNN